MIGDLPIPISRVPSSMSILVAPIVTDQNQIKPLHNPWNKTQKKSQRGAGTKSIEIRSNNTTRVRESEEDEMRKKKKT